MMPTSQVRARAATKGRPVEKHQYTAKDGLKLPNHETVVRVVGGPELPVKAVCRIFDLRTTEIRAASV